MSEHGGGSGLEFGHLWMGVLTLFSLIGSFVLHGFRADNDEAKKRADAAAQEAREAKDALAAHKTYAAETFMPRGTAEKKLDQIFEELGEIKDRLPRKNGG